MSFPEPRLLTYLGRVVGQGNVVPVQAKVQAVSEFPPPTTKKELQRFLGLVGYYRSFCRNFSTVVFPLTELLKGGAKFVWLLEKFIEDIQRQSWPTKLNELTKGGET